MTNNTSTFLFEGYSIVNIKTGEYTPVDKDGKPIIVKSEKDSE